MKQTVCDFCEAKITTPSSQASDEEYLAMLFLEKTKGPKKVIEFDLCGSCQTKVSNIIERTRTDIRALRNNALSPSDKTSA